MLGNLVTVLTCLTVAGAVAKSFSWQKNHGIAKASGFPVFYSPVHIIAIWWLMLYPLLLPILRVLPKTWKNPWLPMSQAWSIWKAGHQPFEEVDSDTFVLATPSGNILWTCDAAVASQLFNQHSKSQLPINIFKFWNIWGPTVGSVEGDEWKTHRKVVTSAFTPATNKIVWDETIHQTKTLIDYWKEKEASTIPVVKKWTSRLALHVISAVFFDKTLHWKEDSQDARLSTPGHRMSYEKALFTVIERLGTLFVTPRALLDKLPFKATREANVAFTEWTKYMNELREGAISRIDEVAAKKNKTILESIVVAGTPGPMRPVDRPLPEESVLGNIFFILLAGHETTGNTMAFTLLLLAIYPEWQRKIQGELDRQLENRPNEKWTVERDCAALQQGYIGAVQKEALRVYNVAQFTMRKTVAAMTVVDSKGNSHTIPADTLCLPNFAAAFRNPAVWAQPKLSADRRAELHDSPAIQFDPSRWLKGDGMDNEEGASGESDNPKHYPFGQGPRSCPGRAFAQTEMTAAVATILKGHTLELVVDENLVEACNGDYGLACSKTRDQAIRTLIDDVECNITLYLQKDLPIKIVKRVD